MNEAPQKDAFAKIDCRNLQDFGKIGVLLVNLGTPDDTDYWSMRIYGRGAFQPSG